ncbi:MAG: hypothetical protein VX640_04235 [Pseudomonadota bacterium]|nr:hypothetical protein [Pseudomonadota bacterium]
MASEALREEPPVVPVGKQQPGMIEGGLDAIVIGANFDGLAAAALLGKAGLKTVLLAGGDASSEQGPREFAPGYFCADGDQLVDALDPELIAALDLYRHGLAFAARRLETVYYFSDGGALLTDGDLYRLRDAVTAMSEDDAASFAAFSEAALDAARALRPMFEGGDPPALNGALVDRFLHGSVEETLDGLFTDDHLKEMLAAEAAFRAAARPSDPYGFLSLIRRWSGEAAGLQGAIAYPEGGSAGVNKAMRRAAQASRVDFRLAVTAKRVLVEWDSVAGVETEGGGQIRAPIIVNALSAERAFAEMIGPSLIDIEFQAALTPPPPAVASARVHLALDGVPGDERTRGNLARRLVYAPSRIELRRAYAAARAGWPAGEAPPPLIMEAIFPSAFEKALAPEGGHSASALLHPVPYVPEADANYVAAVERAARAAFDKLAPGAAERIVAVDVAPPEPAAPPVLTAWTRARALAGASGVKGYFFCGPEAQIGRGFIGAAGRRVAQAAIRFSRGKAAAA